MKEHDNNIKILYNALSYHEYKYKNIKKRLWENDVIINT